MFISILEDPEDILKSYRLTRLFVTGERKIFTQLTPRYWHHQKVDSEISEPYLCKLLIVKTTQTPTHWLARCPKILGWIGVRCHTDFQKEGNEQLRLPRTDPD